MERLATKADLIEALRGLTERLTAPDLTLDESKALRAGLSEVLGRLAAGAAGAAPRVGLPNLNGNGKTEAGWSPAAAPARGPDRRRPQPATATGLSGLDAGRATRRLGARARLN